ncbi:hypothetical protein CPB86DRAFT_783934 [Serendipita vermifera]|nr:hypothetical protein CPB86DRAFT_783934 [Serendipita vermifera]
MSSDQTHEVPGSVLRTITEEYSYLEQFRILLGRRLVIPTAFSFSTDRKSDLKKLRETVNPAWTRSAIGPLVLPAIEMLDEEIKARGESHETVMSYLKRFLDEGQPIAETPTVVQDTQVMTMEYGRLSDLYAKFENIHERSRAPEAITAMEEWFASDTLLLPTLDREYRQAVSLQQGIVERVQLWHNEELPSRLSDHQDHIERVKTLTKRVVFEYSNMASKVVSICSKTIDSTEKFLCLNAIESSDERRLAESWHKHFQPVSYHNFALGAKRARPIFGTDSTPEVVLTALTRLQAEEGEVSLPVGDPRDVKEISLGLEQRCSNSSVDEVMAQEPAFKLRSYIEVCLHLTANFRTSYYTPRLTSLPETFPRDEISPWINGRSQLTGAILAKFFNLSTNRRPNFHMAATLLTHQNDAAGIMANIYRKWDFYAQRPLPADLERRWELKYGPRLWNIKSETYVVESEWMQSKSTLEILMTREQDS